MQNRALQMQSEDDAEESYVRKRQYVTAVVIWCVAGFGNALFTWHLLWLPGLLIVVPGIFFAWIIAAVFFIPLSRIMKKIRAGWEADEEKNWKLLAAAMVLKVFLYLGPLVGSVFYVHILRTIIQAISFSHKSLI